MTYIHICKPFVVILLAAIVLTSASYAYYGDSFGFILPNHLTTLQWIVLWPTEVASGFMGDRARADILAFVFWFVFQAVALIVVYFGACVWISRPNKKGKDIE